MERVSGGMSPASAHIIGRLVVVVALLVAFIGIGLVEYHEDLSKRDWPLLCVRQLQPMERNGGWPINEALGNVPHAVMNGQAVKDIQMVFPFLDKTLRRELFAYHSKYEAV